MSISSGAQLRQPYWDDALARQPYWDNVPDEQWRKKRLELLRPAEEQRHAKRRWETLPYVAIVVLLFTVAFAYIYFDAKIGEAGREINRLDTLAVEEYNMAQRTELEIGTLSSLTRIESYAKLHLNMVYPDIGAVQYLDQRVSGWLADQLSILAEDKPKLAEEAITATKLELEPEPETVAKPQAEQEHHPLITAWIELIGGH
ncbi:MAG: hypothetical protein FWG43_05070 [Clostridiales bacterium]|nr:hypothetical protein [Clostridiales bacterium]